MRSKLMRGRVSPMKAKALHFGKILLASPVSPPAAELVFAGDFGAPSNAPIPFRVRGEHPE